MQQLLQDFSNGTDTLQKHQSWWSCCLEDCSTRCHLQWWRKWKSAGSFASWCNSLVSWSWDSWWSDDPGVQGGANMYLGPRPSWQIWALWDSSSPPKEFHRSPHVLTLCKWQSECLCRRQDHWPEEQNPHHIIREGWAKMRSRRWFRKQRSTRVRMRSTGKRFESKYNMQNTIKDEKIPGNLNSADIRRMKIQFSGQIKTSSPRVMSLTINWRSWRVLTTPSLAARIKVELVELLHHMELMMMRCLQAVVMLDLRLRKLIRVSSNKFLSNSMLEKKFQVIVQWLVVG